MDDEPKFETWDRQTCVDTLRLWYRQMQLMHDTIQQAQGDLKDAMEANRVLLRKLKGEDDDWK